MLKSLFLFAVVSLSAAASSVVVVHSYPPNDWTNGISSGIAQSLKGTEITPYHFHSSYWEERPESELAAEKARILAVIHKKKPKAVLLCDDEASDLLIGDLLKSEMPIFVTGVNRIYSGLSWKAAAQAGRVSGVLEAYPVEKAVQVMKTAFPKSRSFSIVTSDTPTSDRTIEAIKSRQAEAFWRKNQLNLRRTYKLSAWEGWKQAVQEINEKDDFVWFLIPYGVHDGNNQDVTPSRMIKWLNENLKVPSIGPRTLSDGLLLTVGISPLNLGRETGEAIDKFIRGTPLAKIPLAEAGSYELIIKDETYRKRFEVGAIREAR